MQKLMWLAAPAIAALWLALMCGSEERSSDLAGDRAEAGGEQLSRAQTDVDSLRESLARAERRIAQLETAKPNGVEPNRAEPSEPDREAKSAPAQFSNEDRDAHVARVFAAEGVDPSWHAEPEIRSLLAGALPSGSQLRGMDCRSSLCRVETTHRTVADQKAYVNTLFLPRAVRPLPFAGMMFQQSERADGAGQLTTLTYFVRLGHELPSPDQSRTE